MARIQFKAKAEDVHYAGEDAPRYQRVKIPELKRAHCDMHAFRIHAKYGAYANSDLFPAMLARLKRERFGSSGYIRLDAVPEGVQVDASGFLVSVSFEV